LKNFFNNEKGAYEFTILAAADNAKPLRDIKVAFDFDPKADGRCRSLSALVLRIARTFTREID